MKEKEAFQLQFGEEVYIFVIGCPTSSPSKQKYLNLQHETMATTSCHLIYSLLGCLCYSWTVGYVNSELGFHRISQPLHWNDIAKEKVHIKKIPYIFFLPVFVTQGTHFTCLKAMDSTFLVTWPCFKPENIAPQDWQNSPIAGQDHNLPAMFIIAAH